MKNPKHKNNFVEAAVGLVLDKNQYGSRFNQFIQDDFSSQGMFLFENSGMKIFEI